MSLTKTIELGPSKVGGTAKNPKIEYLDPRLTVTLGVITAKESFQADEYIGGSDSDRVAFKVYAICAVRNINGAPVHPLANSIEFDAVRDRFNLFELGELVAEFRKFSVEAAAAGRPKDSSVEPASDA